MSTKGKILPPSMRFIERDWLSSNNILFFDSPDSATLVDTGYHSQSDLTWRLLSHCLNESVSKPSLKRIINTHLHSDHCGGNAMLQSMTQAEIFIPIACAQAVQTWDEDALSFKETGQQCDRFQHAGVISPNQDIELGGLNWRALSAAGHDPSMFVLYCATEGLVISADVLWENGFGVIFPELEGDSGFSEQRASLNMISQLDVRCVLPGHGGTFTDFKAALTRAQDRIDYLSADPIRNARNGLKALVKFLLLERQSLSQVELAGLLESSALFSKMNTLYFDRSALDLARYVFEELVRAKAAVYTDGRLTNS
jgi:glyoxylase-like metal-dependent hydrolase (beta-lactamase superfamily II)